jgi:hypothetical protein
MIRHTELHRLEFAAERDNRPLGAAPAGGDVMTGARTMAISAEVEGSFRLGDVFSKSFGVFGRHIVTFLLLSLLARIPAFVLALAAPTPRLPATGLTPAFFARVLVAFICGAIAKGAMIYGVMQDLRGGAVSIAQTIAIAARRFLPLLGLAVSLGFLSLLASLLLVVPGIIVSCIVLRCGAGLHC